MVKRFRYDFWKAKPGSVYEVCAIHAPKHCPLKGHPPIGHRQNRILGPLLGVASMAVQNRRHKQDTSN